MLRRIAPAMPRSISHRIHRPFEAKLCLAPQGEGFTSYSKEVAAVAIYSSGIVAAHLNVLMIYQVVLSNVAIECSHEWHCKKNYLNKKNK